MRRPFSLWTLIVIGFIVINVIRGFLATGGGTAPITTQQPVATTASSSSIDPNVTPGPIDFGTAANDDCTVVGARTVFSPGTRIWWYAHLGTVLPGSARIVTKLTYGGSVLESLTGPDQTSFGGWDTLCAGEPIRYFGIGTYRLEVWDSSERVLLAAGEYQLVAETVVPSPTPLPSIVTGAIEFGSTGSEGCVTGGKDHGFTFFDEVWWVAHLGQPQSADTPLTYVEFTNGDESSRVTVMPESHGGHWDRVCAWAAFRYIPAGWVERIEIWDQYHTLLLAEGGFRVAPTPPTPFPT